MLVWTSFISLKVQQPEFLMHSHTGRMDTQH